MIEELSFVARLKHRAAEKTKKAIANRKFKDGRRKTEGDLIEYVKNFTMSKTYGQTAKRIGLDSADLSRMRGGTVPVSAITVLRIYSETDLTIEEILSYITHGRLSEGNIKW